MELNSFSFLSINGCMDFSAGVKKARKTKTVAIIIKKSVTLVSCVKKFLTTV